MMTTDYTYEGHATGDSVRYVIDGRTYEYSWKTFRADPYPFVEYNGEAQIGSCCGTHEDLCYFCKNEMEIKVLPNRGRMWVRPQLISIWYLTDDAEGRTQLKNFLPKLEAACADKFHKDFDFYEWKIAIDNHDSVILIPIKDFLNTSEPSPEATDIKRNSYDMFSAKRAGEKSYADWMANSPHADKMYAHVSEAEIKRMVSAVIRNLNEEYLYHKGAGLDMNNPEPYHSEGRGQKWDGGGHETGSFGSGTYFTSANPRDGNLSAEDKELIKNTDKQGRFIQLRPDNGKGGWRNRSGLYRVDTSFYSNLYQLASEKEGDMLKDLMNSLNSAVASFRRIGNYNGRDYNYIGMRHRQNSFLRIRNLAQILGLKMPWNYKGFCEFGKWYCENEDIQQTPATIFMEKNGYNGVDATYAGRYDSYWEGSVIYDLNKVKGDIEPVRTNTRDTWKISHPESGNGMYDDILNNKSNPHSFKGKEIFGNNADDPQKVLMALKRYDMVLPANRFLVLPDDLKREYLKILYINIKKGFVSLQYDYSWFRTDGKEEITNRWYTEAIIENQMYDFVNLDKSIAYAVYRELASVWKYNADIVKRWAAAYKGDDEGVIDEIDWAKEMNDVVDEPIAEGKIFETKGGNYDITFKEESMFKDLSMGFGKQRQMIVIVNGEEMSVDKVNFIVQLHNFDGVTYYQPHILLAPEYQHKGLGYGIYTAFIREYGNLYSQHWMRANQEEMPRIWEKLKSEPDIVVGEDERCFVAVRKDLVE